LQRRPDAERESFWSLVSEKGKAEYLWEAKIYTVIVYYTTIIITVHVQLIPTTSSTVCRSDVKICRYGAHVLLNDKKYTKTIAHNYRNSASQLLGNSASISRVISTIRFT